MLKALYRPFAQATVSTLVSARSVGHYRVALGWKQKPLNKAFVQLFWGMDGEGVFRFGEASWRLLPGQVCFYFPGDIHDLTPLTPEWEYCWMTFDGPFCPAVIAQLRLERRPVEAGRCPEELFLRLANELRDFSPDGQYLASGTAYQILLRALMRRDRFGHGGDIVEGFRRLVQERYSDPGLEVSDLAAELGVHRTTLNRVFHAHTGMTPGEHLNSFRVQEALILLKETSLQIGEIAAQTGFGDQNYFAKVIRRFTGQSPRSFRRG